MQTRPPGIAGYGDPHRTCAGRCTRVAQTPFLRLVVAMAAGRDVLGDVPQSTSHRDWPFPPSSSCPGYAVPHLDRIAMPCRVDKTKVLPGACTPHHLPTPQNISGRPRKRRRPAGLRLRQDTAPPCHVHAQEGLQIAALRPSSQAPRTRPRCWPLGGVGTVRWSWRLSVLYVLKVHGAHSMVWRCSQRDLSTWDVFILIAYSVKLSLGQSK